MTGIPGFESPSSTRVRPPVSLTEPSPTLPGNGLANVSLRLGLGTLAATRCWFRDRREGFAVSFVLHAVLIGAALLAFPNSPPIQAPPLEGMPVEVLTPSEFATLIAPKIAPPNVVPPAVAIPPTPHRIPTAPRRDTEPPPTMPKLEHATKILSAGALDGVAKASLQKLEGDARFEQLCNIEAMEQIARSADGHVPERAIAYAAADTRMEGDMLIADGGAFLSKGHWYHLAFRCSGTSDRRKIVAFDFAAGAQFPDDDPALPIGGDD